jgi:tetratricopeptide (TPR) repeat protein
MNGPGSGTKFIRPAFLPIALVAVALAGCGTVQRAVVAPPGPAPQQDANWRGREDVRDAIALLNRGEGPAARAKLMRALRRQPGDNIARSLIQQIDTDPRVLLGGENYSYTLREGETLSTVAQRALGNPMLFYALARYNNIAVPQSAVPGQTILVPGRRPAPPQPAARPEQRPAPARPAPAPTPEAAPARPAPRPGNPGQAARLRAQGLASMNAGQVDRAVALLRQALTLDPDNVAIRNDLNRALRIRNTVRSRR